MDTEPTTCTATCTAVFENAQQQSEQRCNQILQCMYKQSTELSKQLEGGFSRFEGVLKLIREDVNKIKDGVQENRNDISLLQKTFAENQKQIERLQNSIEKLEIFSRQYNLKIFGIYDNGRNDDEADIKELVTTLNSCSPNHRWNTSDFEKCHRLGQPRRGGQAPRPMIVTFRRMKDKLLLLRDREIRDSLRREQVKISADLTVRQRETIQYFREQGKSAFYVNGKLRVADNNKQESGSNTRYDKISVPKPTIRPNVTNRQSANKENNDARNTLSPRQSENDSANLSEFIRKENTSRRVQEKTQQRQRRHEVTFDTETTQQTEQGALEQPNDQAHAYSGPEQAGTPHDNRRRRQDGLLQLGQPSRPQDPPQRVTSEEAKEGSEPDAIALESDQVADTFKSPRQSGACVPNTDAHSSQSGESPPGTREQRHSARKTRKKYKPR